MVPLNKILLFGSFYILTYSCFFLLPKNIENWVSFAVGLTFWINSINLHPPQSNDPFQIPDQQFVELFDLKNIMVRFLAEKTHRGHHR